MREKIDTRTKSLVIENTEFKKDADGRYPGVEALELLLNPRWEELNGSIKKSKEARKKFDVALSALCGDVESLLRDCRNIAALSLETGESDPSLFTATDGRGWNRIKSADAFFISEVAEIYEHYFQKTPKAVPEKGFDQFLYIVTREACPRGEGFSYSLRSLRAGLKYFSASKNFVATKELKPNLSELDRFIRSFYRW